MQNPWIDALCLHKRKQNVTKKVSSHINSQLKPHCHGSWATLLMPLCKKPDLMSKQLNCVESCLSARECFELLLSACAMLFRFIIVHIASVQSGVSQGSAISMSLKSRINARPIAHARFTGTAFPICLYWSLSVPANCQSSGNVCIRAYSLIVNGRVSSGW